MINFNLKPHTPLFTELDRLLAQFPKNSHVNLELDKSIEELLSSIDIGGFEMQRRDITQEQLDSIISRHSAGDILSANGRAIAIYIEDYTGTRPTYDTENMPKIHLINCGSISHSKPKRFVMVANPTGDFDVIFCDKIRYKRQCRLCIRCLKTIKHNKYGLFDKIKSNKDEIDWCEWNKFAVSYNSYNLCAPSSDNTSKHPSRMLSEENYTLAGTRSAEEYGYTSDFPEISKRKRKKSDWTCSCCHVKLIKHRVLLHTHHANRNKQDNSDCNLFVLCILCHRNQGLINPNGKDDHQWLKNNPNWETAQLLIPLLRNIQNV